MERWWTQHPPASSFVMPKNSSKLFGLCLSPGKVFYDDVTQSIVDYIDKIPTNKSFKETELIDEFIPSVFRSISELQYNDFPKYRQGLVIGGRETLIYSVAKLVEYWLTRYADSRSGVSFVTKEPLTDTYGNKVRLGCLRFNRYRGTDVHFDFAVDGNIPVTIYPVLVSYLHASMIKRFLAKYFPSLMATKRNTFYTVWSMRLRLWTSPEHYYEQEICKFDAMHNLIPPLKDEIKRRRKLQNEHRERLIRLFGYEGGIRIRKVGKA